LHSKASTPVCCNGTPKPFCHVIQGPGPSISCVRHAFPLTLIGLKPSLNPSGEPKVGPSLPNPIQSSGEPKASPGLQPYKHPTFQKRFACWTYRRTRRRLVNASVHKYDCLRLARLPYSVFFATENGISMVRAFGR
jgi:hypothetical protein